METLRLRQVSIRHDIVRPPFMPKASIAEAHWIHDEDLFGLLGGQVLPGDMLALSLLRHTHTAPTCNRYHRCRSRSGCTIQAYAYGSRDSAYHSGNGRAALAR